MVDLVKCAKCGKQIKASDAMKLAWEILKMKPVCSLECSLALGGFYDKPKKMYICQYCGFYEAYHPKCNKCEEEK